MAKSNMAESAENPEPASPPGKPEIEHGKRSTAIMRTTDKLQQDYGLGECIQSPLRDKYASEQKLAEEEEHFTENLFSAIDINKNIRVDLWIDSLKQFTQVEGSKDEATGGYKWTEKALPLFFVHIDSGKKYQCDPKATEIFKYTKIVGKALEMASSHMAGYLSTPAQLIGLYVGLSCYGYLSFIAKKTVLTRKECLDRTRMFEMEGLIGGMLDINFDHAAQKLQMIVSDIKSESIGVISQPYRHYVDAYKRKLQYYKFHSYESQELGQTPTVADEKREEQRKAKEEKYINQSKETINDLSQKLQKMMLVERYLQQSTDLQRNKFNLKNLFEHSYDDDEMSNASRKRSHREDSDDYSGLTNTPDPLTNKIDPSDSDAESLDVRINEDPLSHVLFEDDQGLGKISQKAPCDTERENPDAVDEVPKGRNGEETSPSRHHLDPKHNHKPSMIGDDKRAGDERSKNPNKTKLKLAEDTTPKRSKSGGTDKITFKLVTVEGKGERKKDIAMHEKLGDRPFGIPDSGEDRHDTLMSSTSSVSESGSPFSLGTEILKDPMFRLRVATEGNTSVTTATEVGEEPLDVYDSSSDDSTHFEATEAHGTCDNESDNCSELVDSFDQQDDVDDGRPEAQDDVTIDSADQNSFYDDQDSFHDDQDGFCETAEDEAHDDFDPPTPPLSVPVQVCSPGNSDLEFRSYPDDTFYEGDFAFWATLENHQYRVLVSEGMYDHENNGQVNPHAAVQESGPFDMIGACGEGGTACEEIKIDDGEGNVNPYAENQMSPCVFRGCHSYSSTPHQSHSGFGEQNDHYSPAYSARLEREPRPLTTPTLQTNLPMGVPSAQFLPQQAIHQHFNVSVQPQTSPFLQSEASGSNVGPACTVLPPIMVHAAGSRPPWATTEARIDLSRAHSIEFMDMRRRRATYDITWALNTSGVDAANMALAGFYRLDPNGRRVRCFYCGVELDALDDGQNVWVEHVRQSPSCDYLRAVRGEEDVREIQRGLDRKE